MQVSERKRTAECQARACHVKVTSFSILLCAKNVRDKITFSHACYMFQLALAHIPFVTTKCPQKQIKQEINGTAKVISFQLVICVQA